MAQEERLAEINLADLPESRSIRQAAFETWLAAIHQPSTAAEKLAVRDLAHARLELAEAESRYQLRMEYEATVAPAAFDRAQLDDYHRLDRLWRKDVYAAHELFIKNLHGARAIARTWHALVDDTEPSAVGPTLERAVVAMLSEKEPWKIQELTDGGWAIMGRVLASCAYADEMISDWLKRSGLKQTCALGEQIRQRLKELTDAEKARQELHQMACSKAEAWANSVSQLQLQMDEARQQQARMVMGVGEKGMTSAMRTARSILKFHNEEVRKRERRLMEIQKERLKAEKAVKKPVSQGPDLKKASASNKSPAVPTSELVLPKPVQDALIQKRSNQIDRGGKTKTSRTASSPKMQLTGR